MNAMKGFIGNPIKLFLIGLSVIALLDIDLPALFAAFSTLGVIATYVRADPPIWLGPFLFHHSTSQPAPRRTELRGYPLQFRR
jgi:hypothetical protein